MNVHTNLPTSLLETVKIPLSDRQTRVMEIIDEEDYIPVRKKVRFEASLQNQFLTEEYLNEGIFALKQYYAICFMDDNAHAISFDLDPFWHAHILYTVQYHRFSEKLGIGYMHHAPNDPDSESETSALRVLYDHTQEVFEHCFNWISPVFNPKKHSDRLLLCSHYTQTMFVEKGDNALPPLAHIQQAEQVFVQSRQIPAQ